MAQLVARMHGVHEARGSSPRTPTNNLMNPLILISLLIWVAAGFFVVQFVRRTGGTTVIGRIAHWFGGAFVMFGLAVGLLYLSATLHADFATRLNDYLISHQLSSAAAYPLVATDGSQVTVYRQSSVNRQARMEDGRVVIDESRTVATSLGWMIFGLDSNPTASQ